MIRQLWWRPCAARIPLPAGRSGAARQRLRNPDRRAARFAEFSDPFKVGGLEAVDGPTGLRPDAKAESREVTDTDGGEIDLLAGQSVSDLGSSGSSPTRTPSATS